MFSGDSRLGLRPALRWMLAAFALIYAAGCAPIEMSEQADDTGMDGDAGLEIGSKAEALWFWEDDCVLKTFNGVKYYICTRLNTWDAAKTRCSNVGMKLVKIDSQAENDFIQANVKFANWTGGRVPRAGANQIWTWDFDGSSICKSGWLGCTALNGAYTRWFAGEPLAGLTCLYQEAFTKEWHAGACGVMLGFVCENPDSCPNDPLKLSPGVCGCGNADVDTDADGVLDCRDECTADKTKATPGQCGCGVPDKDTDLDGVPDCDDLCPTVKGLYFPGTCGCGNAVAPAGTICRDGISPTATDTCNGSGVCGNPAAGAPGRGTTGVTCVWRVRKGTTGYWFCGGATSWTAADAMCRAVGGQLTNIDDAAENAFIKANTKLWSWISANDRVTDGAWRLGTKATQNGPLFWQGGPAPIGKRTPSGYAQWSSGQPAVGAAACGRVGTAGTWEAQSCTQGNGFICEFSIDAGVAPKPGGAPGGGAPIAFDPLCTRAGISCALNPEFVTPCVAPQVAFSEFYRRDANGVLLVDAEGNFIPDTEAWLAAAGACDRCLRSYPSQDSWKCGPTGAGVCKGALIQPPTGSVCTETFNIDPTVMSTCRIVTPDYVAVDPTWSAPKSCETNADCDTARGKVCGFYQYGDPDDPRAYDCTRLDDDWTSAEAGNCTNQSTAVFAVTYKVCGVPVPSCPDNAPDTKPCKSEPEVCASEYKLYTADKVNPFPGNLLEQTNMDNEPFELRGISTEAAQAYPAGGPGGKDTCANPEHCRKDETHAWCSYKLGSGETVAKQGKDKPRTGKGGSGSLVEFDLAPKIKLEFKAMKDIEASNGDVTTPGEDRLPGAFGYLDYGLNARAEFVAKAKFKLTKALHGTLDVVNLVAQVKADKCGATTGETKFKLFGKDYIAQVTKGLITPGNPFTFPGDAKQQDVCRKTFQKYETAVNRAKKAYRDAQELLVQYKDYAAKGQNFGNLCTALAAQAPIDFPKGSGACGTEAPEETINRFILYYNGEIQKIRDSVTIGKSNIGGTDGILKKTVTLYEYGPVDTEETLFTSTFLIGPVPVNLEVLSLLHYGVNTSFTAMLNPWGPVQAALKSGSDLNKVTLGELTLTGTPYVGVGVALFVGVGFDCGVAAAKAGAEGALSLGDVSLPVYAGVQLNLAQAPDPRVEAPADLKSLIASVENAKIPTRNYNLSFRYMFGADLHLGNIMSGKVSAKVKIKFFWFSRTWRATLFQFQGLCPGTGPSVTVNGMTVKKFEPDPGPIKTPDMPCHFPLFTGDGATSLSTLAPEWATISMPLPFYELDLLQGTRPAAATPGGFSPVKAKELFYDSLCACISDPVTEAKDDILDVNGKLMGPADRLCTRNDDCCAEVPTCFPNPEFSGKRECSACRKVTTAESCNVNSDCCGFGLNTNVLGCFKNPWSAAGSASRCSNKRLINESCNATTDCVGTATLGCWYNPAWKLNHCSALRVDGELCNKDADCKSFTTNSGSVCYLNQGQPVKTCHAPGVIII